MSRSWPETAKVRERLDGVALALPGVQAQDAYGHRSYLLKGKRIAWQLVDHHGDDRLALWVKAPPGEQRALVDADPARYFVPPYLGPSGWVGVLVDDAQPARLGPGRRLSSSRPGG